MVDEELVEQLRGARQKNKALGSRLVSCLLPDCHSGVVCAFPSLSLRRCLRNVVWSTVVGVLYRVVVHLHTVSHAVVVGRNGTTSKGRLGAARFISTCASQVWDKAASCGGEPLEHRESTCDSRGTSMMALLKIMSNTIL
jgi:hypothetical protein